MTKRSLFSERPSVDHAKGTDQSARVSRSHAVIQLHRILHVRVFKHDRSPRLKVKSMTSSVCARVCRRILAKDIN